MLSEEGQDDMLGSQ